MDMLSASKAARQKMAKLKLCDSLAVYLDELAPKVEVKAAEAKAVDHGGMAVMGKTHGDVAESDQWAGLATGGKKKKGKKKKQGKAGLAHDMIRLNGFAEVGRCGTATHRQRDPAPLPLCASRRVASSR